MLTKIFILAVAMIGIPTAENSPAVFSPISSEFDSATEDYAILRDVAAPDHTKQVILKTEASLTLKAETPLLNRNRQETEEKLQPAIDVAKKCGYNLTVSFISSSLCKSSTERIQIEYLRVAKGNECVFCFCKDITDSTPDPLASCRATACGGLGGSAFDSWHDIKNVKEWTILANAVDYQLYRVAKSYCYMESIKDNTKRMQCYEVSTD